MPRDIASSSVTTRSMTTRRMRNQGGQTESTSLPVDRMATRRMRNQGGQTESTSPPVDPMTTRRMQNQGGQTESTSPPVDRSQAQREPVTIPRVRGLLRRASRDLFTPQTVPIGPYHVQAGSYLLQSTLVKNRAVELIEETESLDREGLQKVVNNLVDEVWPCYTHLPEHSMNSQEFSSMLLLDGCYLLCRFIKFGASGSGSRSDSGDSGSDLAAGPVMLDKDNSLVRDILYLLENQIPLSVLEAILSYIFGTENMLDSDHPVFKRGVHHVLHTQKYISEKREPVVCKSSDLLHLVYSYFRRGPQASVGGLKDTGRWRRATDYSKYGDVQFRRRQFREEEQWTILDVVLQGGTLYIPFLQVDNDTWTLLRNLMALEEQEKERPVTAYCFFMSQVACTAEDVQLLQEADILQHFMPNDTEAAKAFSYLCDGVAMDINRLDRNYLNSLWHDLQKRCSEPVYNFKGFFREEYCSTVFYRLVLLVAILGFVCDVTQTIYAVIAYHWPT